MRSIQFPKDISRRDFVRSSLLTLAVSIVTGCIAPHSEVRPVKPRLTVRLGTPSRTPTKGLTHLAFQGGPSGIFYVPESYSSDIAMPLFIAMHCADGNSSDWMSFRSRAEERGMILLAPDSRASTWDLMRGGYGADLRFLDEALKYVFDRCRIDPMHISLSGFSDGATYALSLGISNGDLFTHLIGYSPGFIAGRDPIVGKPRIYISHGTQDAVFPVQTIRDNIVPAFRKTDYDVTYNEFEGGHEVPAAVSEASLDWFLGDR